MEQQELPNHFNSASANSLQLKAAMAILRTSGCSYIVDDPLTGERHLHGRVMVDVAVPPGFAATEAPPPPKKPCRRGRYAHLIPLIQENLHYGEELSIAIPEETLSGKVSDIHNFRTAIRHYAESIFPVDSISVHRYIRGATTASVSRSKRVA